MSTNDITTADLFYSLRESVVKIVSTLYTLGKFFVFAAAAQLILIAYMFWKLADSESDLLLLGAMFCSTALPLSWALIVLPDQLRAVLEDGLKRPTGPGEQPPQ